MITPADAVILTTNPVPVPPEVETPVAVTYPVPPSNDPLLNVATLFLGLADTTVIVASFAGLAPSRFVPAITIVLPAV